MAGATIARDAVRAAYVGMGSGMPFVERRQRLMGGTGAIVLVGAGEELLAECFALADRCESAWSRFLPDSDVTRLNWSRGRPIEVDPLTIRLLESMIAGAELTAHDYNPTILPDLLAAGYTASTLDGSRITTVPAECRTAPRLEVTFAGDEVRIPAESRSTREASARVSQRTWWSSSRSPTVPGGRSPNSGATWSLRESPRPTWAGASPSRMPAKAASPP